MINNLKYIALIICITATTIVSALDNNCVNCGPDSVSGLPSNKSLGQIEKTIKAAAIPAGYREATQKDYFNSFCMEFTQTPKEMVVTLLKSFEKTPFPPDEYLIKPLCQPENYSDAVKSPMTHYIAENPESRGEFLYRIWLYYNKGRKQPELFVKVLNAKNTKGETILDYIESIRLKGYNKHPGLQEPIRKLISFICTNGGVYEAYKEKTCEN